MSPSEALSERRRFALMDRLIEELGEEEAETLMASLPPVAWADLATKDDLRNLEDRLSARIARIDARFEQIDGRFAQVDARFEQIDARFEQIDARFEHIDARFVGQRGHFELQLAKSVRTMVFAMLAFSMAIIGTVLGTGLGA
ncbi:hypothetical protein [Candidatus Poriferisocius sp.]|uniref:hypothetical protein n=1 Tax=Candidatus Poriferisocius sp. TaxID=3101276 RepID=UPI003B5A4AFA